MVDVHRKGLPLLNFRDCLTSAKYGRNATPTIIVGVHGKVSMVVGMATNST